jgi:hypothetical protein
VLPDWLPLSDLNVVIELLTGAPPTTPLPPFPIPIGRWFYNPPEDGIRSLTYTIAEFLYELTNPDQGVQP